MKMRGLVIMMAVAAISFSYASSTFAMKVSADGKIWRQLTETIQVSYTELDVIYDTATGLLDPSAGSTMIGSVDFAGWTWADDVAVASLFSSYTGLTISAGAGQENELNSAWAPTTLSDFDYTGGTFGNNGPATRHIQAVTRTTSSSRADRAYAPAILDSLSALGFDQAFMTKAILKDNHIDSVGVWLYETPAAPVPEPTTIALLGIGLVGLAGAEVRRRRKKNGG